MNNGGLRNDTGAQAPLRYRLCPRCSRAVPVSSSERYCVNDGAQLLEACQNPGCGEPILSPYARFCAGCGSPLLPPPGPPRGGGTGDPS